MKKSTSGYISRILGTLFLLFLTIATTLNKYDWGWNNTETLTAAVTEIWSPRPKPAAGPTKEAPGSDAGTTVVIRIDDAKKSALKYLVRILKEHGLPFELEVVNGSIGKPEFMTESEIDDTIKWGARVEDHTWNHHYLTKQTPKEWIKELVESRKDLKKRFGREPQILISPMGDYNSKVLKAIREAGFLGHAGAYGAEDPEKKLTNEPVNGKFNNFELAGYDIKPYFSAQHVCDYIKNAEKKEQLVILVYHFAQRRGEPPEDGDKNPFLALEDTDNEFPPELTVFEDVFEATAKCLKKERDAGRIRLDFIADAISYYEERYQRKKQEGQLTSQVHPAPVELSAQYKPTELVERAMAPLLGNPPANSADKP